MSSTEELVFSAALALPEQSRAQLADMLWASLPEEQLDLFLTDEVCRAWVAEARRRMRDAASGKVALLPGDEVMGRLRSRLQKWTTVSTRRRKANSTRFTTTTKPSGKAWEADSEKHSAKRWPAYFSGSGCRRLPAAERADLGRSSVG